MSSRVSCVKDIFAFVTVKENRLQRLDRFNGNTVRDIDRAYKEYISYCFSFAIMFFRYNLLHESLDLLKRGLKADLQYFRGNPRIEFTWSGRVITSNCLAYLLVK